MISIIIFILLILKMDCGITDLPVVKISSEGRFKYILIKVDEGNNTIYFVRGNKKLQYHDDNFKQFSQEVKKAGYTINRNQRYIKATKNGKQLKIQCLGGGRIQHNFHHHLCFIYGYSKSFGHVDHEIAKKLISQVLGYPLQKIQTSQQGY